MLSLGQSDRSHTYLYMSSYELPVHMVCASFLCCISILHEPPVLECFLGVFFSVSWRRTEGHFFRISNKYLYSDEHINCRGLEGVCLCHR